MLRSTKDYPIIGMATSQNTPQARRNTLRIANERRNVFELIDSLKDERGEIDRSVREVVLPEAFASFIEDYKQISWSRGIYMIKWLWKLLHARKPGIMLSCVPERHRHEAALVKLALNLAATTVDDISDHLKDMPLLEAMLRLPLASLYGHSSGPLAVPAPQHPAIAIVQRLLDYVFKTLETAPMYAEFREIFSFDFKMAWTTFEYAKLLNKHRHIANHIENVVYNCHSMLFFLYADIDLMYSQSFINSDLHRLREMLWHAQQMARISNWISSWEREFVQNDYSSAVITLLLRKGIITPEELSVSNDIGKADVLYYKVKSSGIEEKLLLEWEEHRDEAAALGAHLRSVDTAAYLAGLEQVLLHHLACSI